LKLFPEDSKNVQSLEGCLIEYGQEEDYFEKLNALLSQDLDFHDKDSSYASHNFHSFPAKFPPQLPKKFIIGLTNPGDVVLDPMMGSGTTLVEALLTGRRGIGVDIDKLSILITMVKSTPLHKRDIIEIGYRIIRNAKLRIMKDTNEIEKALKNRFDQLTSQFKDYWFYRDVQIDLLALIDEINDVSNKYARAFFKVAFSAIIITKSGGVSFALDLAHTRPHRAKIVFNKHRETILEGDLSNTKENRIKILTKTLRSPLEEFQKRFLQNLDGLVEDKEGIIPPFVTFGNSQYLPLSESTVDLIITSPPYASNAIDYMRAHKFSLIWMGCSINNLSKKRKEYIGGDDIIDVHYEALPDSVNRVVSEITKKDKKQGRVLRRYFSEMTRTLREMFRVLKSKKAAIVVVGNSTMRGIDTEIPYCLVDIGRSIGFKIPQIGIRNLDRNRRMLPAGSKVNLTSQIQQRMHEEYVLGFYKP